MYHNQRSYSDYVYFKCNYMSLKNVKGVAVFISFQFRWIHFLCVYNRHNNSKSLLNIPGISRFVDRFEKLIFQCHCKCLSRLQRVIRHKTLKRSRRLLDQNSIKLRRKWVFCPPMRRKKGFNIFLAFRTNLLANYNEETTTFRFRKRSLLYR